MGMPLRRSYQVNWCVWHPTSFKIAWCFVLLVTMKKTSHLLVATSTKWRKWKEKLTHSVTKTPLSAGVWRMEMFLSQHSVSVAGKRSLPHLRWMCSLLVTCLRLLSKTYRCWMRALSTLLRIGWMRTHLVVVTIVMDGMSCQSPKCGGGLVGQRVFVITLLLLSTPVIRLSRCSSTLKGQFLESTRMRLAVLCAQLSYMRPKRVWGANRTDFC